jgi:hypothetical protein
MPASKQRPLEVVAGNTEHDFAQPRENWDATVFDRASYFSVVEVHDRSEVRFTVLPWAIRFAQRRESVCLYAVAASGRFALLDREKWPEWEERWRSARSLPARLPPVTAEKPHRGTITEWEEMSAPTGLGFRIEGRMGGRRVSTTSVLRREGDVVETLNWRYTLG